MVGVGLLIEGSSNLDLALSTDAVPSAGDRSAASLPIDGLLIRSSLCSRRPCSPSVKLLSTVLDVELEDNLAFRGLGDIESCLDEAEEGEPKSDAISKLVSNTTGASSLLSECARVRAPATARGALMMLGGPPLDGLRSFFLAGGGGDLVGLVLAAGWNASGKDSRKNAGGVEVLADVVSDVVLSNVDGIVDDGLGTLSSAAVEESRSRD